MRGIIILFLFLISCANRKEDVQAIGQKRLGVDEANTIEAYMSTGGNMRARLRAPQMLRYQDTSSKVVFPKTMHVDFFQDSTEGIIKSQLDAQYGEYFEQRNLVFLKDSVRVFNTTGDTLYCKELWWSQNDQKFYTEKPVRIHRPDMIMIGIGLTAPQDFSYFEMYQISNSIIRVNQ
ncbi:MAG: LPS export ABC transporter periplasmic protein LptC [Chitinophagaceae bacterium]